MNRYQAYNLIFKSQAGKKILGSDILPSQFCDYLEALGLIKFDPILCKDCGEAINLNQNKRLEFETGKMVCEKCMPNYFKEGVKSNG